MTIDVAHVRNYNIKCRVVVNGFYTFLSGHCSVY